MTLQKKQRILFFDHTAKWSGGEISLYAIVTHLDRSRYTPLVVLATEGRLAERMREAGIETIILPLSPEITEVRKDTLGMHSLFHLHRMMEASCYVIRLARLMRQHKIALVHCNSLKSDLVGGLAARMARIPCVWHVRDRIDEAYLPARAAHNFRFLARKIPTGVLANSESTLQSLALTKSSRPYSRVAYPGILLEDFGELPVPPANEDLKRIILVGRITPWKGQDVFLEAAAKIADRWKNVRFQIVGTPMFNEEEFHKSLFDLVKLRRIENQVEFLGFREDVPALIAQADILVHASKLGEPFGKVVVEGMAARKPVIATDGGGLREIVVAGTNATAVRGETGLLVKMGDADAMANAMEVLLANPARAEVMGRNGRCRAEQLFTAERTTRDVEALFDLILSQKKSKSEVSTSNPKSYGALL